MFRVILGRAWRLLPQGGYVKTCAEAHGFLDYYISRAFKKVDGQQKRSLIQTLSVQTEDANFIRSQVIQAMMAAQDTTSELLTNALFLLARHPRYWQELCSEFAEKVEDDLTAEKLLGSKSLKYILLESMFPKPFVFLSPH